MALVGPLGPLELGIILLILIVIFGPKRLPGAGRALGQGMREFKESLTGKSGDADEDEDEARKLPAGSEEERQPAATAAREGDAVASAKDSSRGNG
jgi:sec-independent protein translocase protein TatA